MFHIKHLTGFQVLCIVSTILTRNPELTFQNQLDLDDLVTEAFRMFCKDTNRDDGTDLQVFFSEKENISAGYFARAVVNNVLKGGQLMMLPSLEMDQTNCSVS